jgi:hypothetical protein
MNEKSEDDQQQNVSEGMMSKDAIKLRTRATSPTAEIFRAHLRERLAQMNEAAQRNGASREYLDNLQRNTEKILQAALQDKAE